MDIAELYEARDAYGRNWLDFQNEMTSLMAQVHSMTTGRFEAAEGRNLVDISIETMNRVVALQAAVAALGGLLAQDTADLTKDEILDTIDRAIQQAVVKVQVDVTRA